MTPQRHGEVTPSALASSRREGSALPSERDPPSPSPAAGPRGSVTQCLECADSAHGDHDGSNAELEVSRASQAPRYCKHESSRRAAGGRAAGIGHMQPRRGRWRRTPARAGRGAEAWLQTATFFSPKVRISTPSTARRRDRPTPPALLCRDCGSRRCACCRPGPRQPASAPGSRSRGRAATLVNADLAPGPDELRERGGERDRPRRRDWRCGSGDQPARCGLAWASPRAAPASPLR